MAVAAHSARANIPDIPYIPVPNKPDFLGNVFCGSEKPITVSLQNVISSMSMGGIDEFLRVASMMKAQKICITQSLAFADNSNFFPEGLRPSTTTMGWLTYVMQKAMENNLSHLI